MSWRPGWRASACLCLLVGAVFRFAWIGDVEYKDDEDQLFHYSQAIPATDLWPAIGTTSGVREIRHPALGIWSFAILAQVFHLETPLALTRGVAGLSLLALVLLFWFGGRLVPAAQREIWLWTAALASVNLAATIYGRKIWIPDLLPIFCVVLLIAWSWRHTPVGALIWGIDGALIGQVHMTGFFYAAAVLVGTVLFARASVRWRAWLVGSAWGAIPALPWLLYLWNHHPTLVDFASTLSPTGWGLAGFFRVAFEISLNQTAEFNLGGDFEKYLAYPVLFGVSTHAVRAVRLVLYSIGAIALVVASAVTLKRLVARTVHWRPSDIHLCFFHAALTGLLMSVAGMLNAPHHHLMVFPIGYLWIPVAVAHLPHPRIWLAVVWLGSAVSTIAFLQFIHQHCGAPNGEYGVAYRCQDDATRIRSPDLEALIRPGQEDVIARMLGRGEPLAGGCRLAEGQIDHTLARGTYTCGESRVTLHLVHPSKAPGNALRTTEFAVVVVEGSPPSGLTDAIAERVRRDEPAFAWLLEAGPTSSVRAESPSSDSPPVLTSRQVLLRMVGGAVVLLLLSPWWGAGVREAR